MFVFSYSFSSSVSVSFSSSSLGNGLVWVWLCRRCGGRTTSDLGNTLFVLWNCFACLFVAVPSPLLYRHGYVFCFHLLFSFSASNHSGNAELFWFLWFLIISSFFLMFFFHKNIVFNLDQLLKSCKGVWLLW